MTNIHQQRMAALIQAIDRNADAAASAYARAAALTIAVQMAAQAANKVHGIDSERARFLRDKAAVAAIDEVSAKRAFDAAIWELSKPLAADI